MFGTGVHSSEWIAQLEAWCWAGMSGSRFQATQGPEQKNRWGGASRGLGGRCGLELTWGASTLDSLRQVGSPMERRAPLQGDMGHLADDLGVNIPRGQQHLGCAGDAVGNAVSLWIHTGLGGWELTVIFEPFRGDVSGGEAMRSAGETHCLLRCSPHCRAGYHGQGWLGYKWNIYKQWTWLWLSSLTKSLWQC